MKKKPIKKLKKEADIWFSRYIRWRDKGQCFTCPKSDDPKKMQAGHFVPRQYTETRYDERNVHAQCYACNVLYHGQPSAYAINLDLRYGRGTVALLEAKRRKIVRDFPYEELIQKYKELAINEGWE